MERWAVEGVMPERAIERLQKGGVSLFFVKKQEKKRILFCINKKDLEKAFAIYPNMCYNNTRESVYSFTRIGADDARTRKVRRLRTLGFCLGICCFFFLNGVFSSFVFRIETVGADVYKRETMEILRNHGIVVFAPYPKSKESSVCAQILSLDGVEFCSLQKRGNVVTVDIRTNAFSSLRRIEGDMVAPCAGIIKNAVVLGGTLLKKQGDKVEVGEKLVGAYFSVGDEELSVKPTEVVARVQLVCERTFEGETPQESVATALLYVENLGGKVLELFPNGNQTKVSYAVTLRMNM